MDLQNVDILPHVLHLILFGVREVTYYAVILTVLWVSV